jgi:hypothetical protein
MQNTTCEQCEGWGKECDLCRVGTIEECDRKPPRKRESIGELLIAAFSEDKPY